MRNLYIRMVALLAAACSAHKGIPASAIIDVAEEFRKYLHNG